MSPGSAVSRSRFTVGIPVYNGRSLLRRCLQSVLASTLAKDRFEVVVVDDGSTEPETAAILREFEQLVADPGFFRVFRSTSNSGGAARPRNRILDEATGDYVFFVDSDDTIGDQALERIADALSGVEADWVALHQVSVNGRSAVLRVRQQQIEVSRLRALQTLTVHKVFRRAEIERQHLRFDEGLPSGQDVAFAFSYLLNAERFLMLGKYDYYQLVRHTDSRHEPSHLSMSARTPRARIAKNERILRSMLAALRERDLTHPERCEVVTEVVLPRLFSTQRQLEAIVEAGPRVGGQALRRLGDTFADPLLTDLDFATARGLTAEQLDAIVKSDWPGLARLVRTVNRPSGPAGRPFWVRRGRRLLSQVSSRAGRAGRAGSPLRPSASVEGG